MKRTTEFLPDGIRIRATPDDVLSAWRAISAISGTYALGTAQHESDYTLNERDIEPPNAKGERYVSMGIFQVGDDEMKAAGLLLGHDADSAIYTLAGSIKVLAVIAAKRADALVRHGKVERTNPDLLAYLALAHNEGLGAALKTVALHGLNWDAWCERNCPGWCEARTAAPARAAELLAKYPLGNMCKYGDDCMTGGVYGALVNPAVFA